MSYRACATQVDNPRTSFNRLASSDRRASFDCASDSSATRLARPEASLGCVSALT